MFHLASNWNFVIFLPIGKHPVSPSNLLQGSSRRCSWLRVTGLNSNSGNILMTRLSRFLSSLLYMEEGGGNGKRAGDGRWICERLVVIWGKVPKIQKTGKKTNTQKKLFVFARLWTSRRFYLTLLSMKSAFRLTWRIVDSKRIFLSEYE